MTGGGTGGGTITPDAGRCAASFCEDFERFDAGRPPSSPWSTTTTTGGAVIVDASRSHRGHQSAKVTTDGQAAYRQAYLALKAPFFPVSGNGFYGRAWLYLTEAPAMTTHWTNISGEGTAMNGATAFQAYVRYGGQVAKHLMANYDSTVFASDCWRQSSVPFPEARWACFEWHFDGPTRTMELWVDGVAVTALTINGTGDGCIGSDLQNQWIFPQFDTLRLGWEHYQTSIAIELWVDDVALDTGRVGCE